MDEALLPQIAENVCLSSSVSPVLAHFEFRYLRHFWLFEARVPHPANAISPQISKFEMSYNRADGRGKAFNISWIIDYGLQITAIDIQKGAICSAKCRFCEINRDADENDDGYRKRKRKERTKY